MKSLVMRCVGRPKQVPDNEEEKRILLERLLVIFKNQHDDNINLSRLFSIIKSSGIRQTDRRLLGMFQRIHQLTKSGRTGDSQQKTNDDEEASLDKEKFLECIDDNLELFVRIVKGELIIPEIEKFQQRVRRLYKELVANVTGKNADYIPQLARVDSNRLGLSICTVDGQRIAIGHVHQPFCLQSTSKALNYAIAVSDFGAGYVHGFIGQEPSGRSFNELTLDKDNKPHNPMINAGAIVCCSLLRPQSNMSERFDSVVQVYKRMAGGEFVGFSNSVYLSERDSADRNYALAYFLKEYSCFPVNSDLEEVLQFYFQLCSVEVNCESGAVIAATLANGGKCPTTDEVILNNEAVRNCLSLMYSCGMYDYSGQFAFRVGLPAKSGVSGAILLVCSGTFQFLVVPNVMGICIWSPRLDTQGNSVRGVQFCERIVSDCNFHQYDNLKYSTKKWDPRRRESDVRASEIVPLLLAAYHGDLSALKRFHYQGVDVNGGDYDQRRALHLAAAEGNTNCVRYLLYEARACVNVRDRWGFTPLDDAIRFGHKEVVKIIQEYTKQLCENHMPSYGDLMASLPSSSMEKEPSNNGETDGEMGLLLSQSAGSRKLQFSPDSGVDSVPSSLFSSTASLSTELK